MMTASFDTPIVVILYNRAARIRELLDVLRIIRPSRLLIVADGPRVQHADDAAACAEARAQIESIDWNCTIERNYATHNLGCDPRVMTGLDWAFSRVDRAIVLEDDILPHPSFFPWAVTMLDRFRADPDVTMVCGRNPLGRWTNGAHDHLRARRGSLWGWATTARAWQRINALDLSGDPRRALVDAALVGADPLIIERMATALRSFRLGQLATWDNIAELRSCLLSGAAIVSPVNLVHHNGLGADATHPRSAGDFGEFVPVATAPAPTPWCSVDFDDEYDRAAVLVDLMSRIVDPPMARRLAGVRIPLSDAARHHLSPFAVPGESLRLLDYLAAQGVSSAPFDRMRTALREAAAMKGCSA